MCGVDCRRHLRGVEPLPDRVTPSKGELRAWRTGAPTNPEKGRRAMTKQDATLEELRTEFIQLVMERNNAPFNSVEADIAQRKLNKVYDRLVEMDPANYVPRPRFSDE